MWNHYLFTTGNQSHGPLCPSNTKVFPNVRHLHVLFLLSGVLFSIIVKYLLSTQSAFNSLIHVTFNRILNGSQSKAYSTSAQFYILILLFSFIALTMMCTLCSYLIDFCLPLLCYELYNGRSHFYFIPHFIPS